MEGGFDVYNIETAMPKIDLDAIESHLRAAREEERRVSEYFYIYKILYIQNDVYNCNCNCSDVFSQQKVDYKYNMYVYYLYLVCVS